MIMTGMRSRWLIGATLFALHFSLFVSCSSQPSKEQSDKAEKLIEAAHKAKDYQQLMLLADSLEKDGSLSSAKAYYWRGYASDRTNHRRMAEFYYDTALKAAGTADPEICAKAASRLANLVSIRGDYESVLKFAAPIAKQLEEMKCDTTSDYINLLIYIGCCQAGLGQTGDEMTDGFDKAYQKHLDNVKKNHTDVAYKDAIAGLINITYACLSTKDYRSALRWNAKFGELVNEYEQRPGITSSYIDKQQARYNIYQSQALVGQGKADEAARAYEAFRATAFSRTPEGRIMANDYLTAAGRWGEAADNYQSLDVLLGEEQGGYTLDNIQEMVLKKYQANILAGRRDTAAAVSMLLCDSLASAFALAKRIDAEEQATIVKKVRELDDQQTATVRRHQLDIYAFIAFLFLLVMGYISYRRRHHHQLKKAHEELRKDYAHIEEAATERSRTETEQRLAAAIMQRHALASPSVITPSLLIFSSPGTTGGGSFCDAILNGDNLIFTVGSATGKGIEGATAAAMAWAQFRTAAILETSPDRIVSAISEAIADDRNIPVKMFVGALNQKTGILQYCNAGNSTPLLYNEEISLLPDEENQPAGAQSGYTYTASQTTIAPGKLMFLYTDGVTEAEDANHEKLGEKQLRGMALQAIKLNARPEAFFKNIQKAVTDFTGGIPQADDLTLMVINRTQSGETRKTV